MSDNIQTGFFVAGGFFAIGCLTWFFSSRPKAFIRTFVPADRLPEAIRAIRREQSGSQGMRLMALLQMAFGVIFGLIAIGAWLLG